MIRSSSFGCVLLSLGLLCAVAQAELRRVPESLLLDIDQVNQRYISVGERGHILLSNDGGTSWGQASSPTSNMLTSVYMRDEQAIWAVGHDHTIIASSDGGQSWQVLQQDNVEQSPLLDIWVGEQYGLAVGAYGQLYRSTDGGQQWQHAFINEEDDFHLNSIALDELGYWYIAAEAGLIYRSEDKGDTWQRLETPYDGSFFDIVLLPDQRLLAVGLRGNAYISSDQGQTWQAYDLETDASIFAATLVREQLVTVGAAATLGRGGSDLSEWYVVEHEHRKAYLAVAKRDADGFIVVGEGGLHALDARGNPVDYQYTGRLK